MSGPHRRHTPCMDSKAKIALQRTQVSPELGREIDAVVGDDVVLKPEAVK